MPGCAGGPDDASVRAGQGGNDLETVRAEMLGAVFTHQLHGGFVGFGATVTEKHPIAEGIFAKQFRQFDLAGDMEIVGAVDQLRGPAAAESPRFWDGSARGC